MLDGDGLSSRAVREVLFIRQSSGWRQAMATVATTAMGAERPDVLSGTPRAHSIDRWIYVGMAAWFILIVLTGFVPDSIMKIAAVQAGLRPTFPLILHVHAVLMGSFLLLLLAQTSLVALGRRHLHVRLGVLGMVLAPALVVAGFMLVPTNYQMALEMSQSGSEAGQQAMAERLPQMENILLMQTKVGILFPLLLAIGLRARGRDAGLHKRMMILATAMPLSAAFARMPWLPSTMPASPLSLEIYVLLAVAPMIAWDVVRNRSIHRAYWIWMAIYLAATAVVAICWDQAWWHATAQNILAI